MKKSVGISIAASLAIFTSVFPVLASSNNLHLDWEKQISKNQCGNTGKQVIEVSEKVVNDADSGLGGYWAFDNYEKHIKVWEEAGGGYCASVSYEGKFQAIVGQKSPGNTGVLTGKEHGEFEGGYLATFTGTLLAKPIWPTHGSVGTVDYKCDVNGSCPGIVSWLGQYFTSVNNFNQPWWGWIYHGGKYGAWINSITGNVGDILPFTGSAKDKDKESNNESD